MGKHCAEEFLDCVEECHRKYGTSWRSYFCTLDCELVFAACVVRDFSRALQGKDLAQATEAAAKMEEVGHTYLIAAANLRAKTTIGYASLKVIKSNSETEPFLPESKLFPSLVATGISPVIARLVTDRTAMKFHDEMSTADIKAESFAELEKIDSKLADECACKKGEKKAESETTNSSTTNEPK